MSRTPDVSCPAAVILRAGAAPGIDAIAIIPRINDFMAISWRGSNAFSGRYRRGFRSPGQGLKLSSVSLC